ncbi:MAG: type II 3-dehydroquinate dehydratase [Micrococcales bacterium]|nr:type II 3-dehydroquinate dehydratase [Micrococcales bacterium]NBR61555.1 type II 3-dehydroquinate dehydratase [Actinomycetota bacterium]NBR55027.1 type II 3-dehydroquinate dehydratase [Micrococcales bacterium]NBT46349.1 type II 3-dehydroquinate dehydratase [Actinomycetota bacterium]NBY44264.1 type II 3-dehydroquinate dehydratase [Micrococcales bacterium]
MKKVVVLNGPNLNMLGSREPDVYGHSSYTDLVTELTSFGLQFGLEVEIKQSNDESELVGWLQEAFTTRNNVVVNPAAFTHYSYSIRDAIAMLTSTGLQVIEVHISNPHAREEFRHNSVISAVATGVIAGFGLDSYKLALRQLAN